MDLFEITGGVILFKDPCFIDASYEQCKRKYPGIIRKLGYDGHAPETERLHREGIRKIEKQLGALRQYPLRSDECFFIGVGGGTWDEEGGGERLVMQ